jgi:hypothetical protein
MSVSSRAKLQHSGFGIVAFILSLTSAVTIFGLVVIAGLMEDSVPGSMDEDSAEVVSLVLGLICSLFSACLSFVFGIIGLLQSRRKKVFAILGTIIGGLTFFGVLGSIVFDTMME